MDDLDAFLDETEEEKQLAQPKDNTVDLDSFIEETKSKPFSDIDSFIEESLPEKEAYTPTVAAPPAETPAPPEGQSYSANDLVLDEYFNPIKDYMVERYGTHINELKRQDIVDKFLNNMRGFAGGNSVRTVSESVFLSQAGDNPEAMQKIGRAYQIYEGMEGVFGDTTLGEKAGAVGDFLRTTVFDPVNLIGFGIAKSVTSSGFKAGSQAAKMAARQAFQKEIAKGATQEVAQKTAMRVFQGKTAEVTARIAAKQASRQAVRDGVKTSLAQKVFNKEAVQEILVMGTFDGAINAATDYLYQDAMLKTKVQDEYNIYQTGLNAIASMVFMGSMAAAGAGVSGLSKIARPDQSLKTAPKNAKLTDLSPELGKIMRIGKKGKKVPESGSWDFKVKSGVELQDQDFEFFTTMLLGNDRLGIKGLGSILQEQGYVWSKRNPDDKVSNWIADIIKNADPQDAKKFLKDFTKATGIKMADGEKLTTEKLADVFARKMSDSMRLGNAASQLAKRLGKKEADVTLDDYTRFVLFGETPDEVATWSTEALGKIPKESSIKTLQNKYIRLLVSNTSTSFLNITGYAAATTLNTAADLVLAAGHAPMALLGRKQSAEAIAAIASNTRFKLQNTLDANMTYDRFLQYVNMRPEAMKELYRVLPGGVEDVKKLANPEDIDFSNVSLLDVGSDQVIDYIQKINLVQAQDSLTKSIEFTTQMDRIIRLPKEQGGLGIKGGWNEFFDRKDYLKIMGSETYAKAEAKAIDESLRSIYSKSFKGKDWVGEIAGVIEDARNIPIIGTMVPFGRFFNNTVAFMADSTMVAPLLRKSGYLVGESGTTRSYSEIMARGAATWSAIYAAAQYEKFNKDLGLGWSEEMDPMTGAVKDERYEFPYAFWKFMGRVTAHVMDGEEIPDELKRQGYQQFFGQFTRQLGEAGASLEDVFVGIFNGDTSLIDMVYTVGAQIASGSTRFLDPANQTLAVFRGEGNYVADNKQGKEALNNTLRYMDHMLDVVGIKERPPEKASAVRGDDLRPQSTKIFSTVREVKTTDTSRMMSALGKPDWDKQISQYSNLAKADNRFNQIFHNLIERGAGNLLKTKRWNEGDLETKRILASELITDAKKATRDYMERLIGSGEDMELRLMIQIQEKSEDSIRATMDDLGYKDKELEDLNYEQLYDLKGALDVRDEFKTR